MSFPDGTNFDSAGDLETYVSKWDTDGNVLWAKHQSGGRAADPTELQVDAAGNVYFLSEFTDTFDFNLDNPGSTTLTRAAPGTDGFLLKLNQVDGAFQSVYHLQAQAESSRNWTLKPNGLAADASGFVYVSGEFTGRVTLPMGEVLTGEVLANELSSSLDLFLLKLNSEFGAIHGQVFNDLDNDGVNNDGAGVNAVTVSMYEDQNANGVFDTGEPTFSTTTDNLGRYVFGNLDLGVAGAAALVVSQTVPAGWTQTFPAATEYIPAAW